MTGRSGAYPNRFKRKWPEEVRAQARAAWAAGLTVTEAAREVGVPRQTVANWAEREGWIRGGPALAALPGSGLQAPARDPVARLYRLAFTILDLADRRVALLRAELRASPKDEAGERWDRTFTACAAGAGRAADCLVKLHRIAQERAAATAEKNAHAEAPARSNAELSLEIARRLEAFYGTEPPEILE